MSSYFDDATRDVTNLCQLREMYKGDGDALIEAVAQIENMVIAYVNLDTGDREFPDDLRERIQGIIAVWNVGYHARPDIPEWHARGREWLLTVKESRLISDLHSAYHEVASRRIRTRFGMLYDSPRGNVKMRDEWDKEQQGAQE